MSGHTREEWTRDALVEWKEVADRERVRDAAPELLDELKGVTAFLGGLIDSGALGLHSQIEASAVEHTRSAREVISKAEGESP